MEYAEDELFYKLSRAFHINAVKRASDHQLLECWNDIKEARVRGWARLGLDHQGGFSFLPRNEDRTLKQSDTESEPFLRVLLRVGIQQFAEK